MSVNPRISLSTINTATITYDALGRQQSITYDAMDRITKTTDAIANVVAYSYNKAGRLIYTSKKTTPSKHIGFYTQHQKEAQAYFDNNVSLQSQYSTIEAKIEVVNDALKTLMEEAQ